MKVLVTGGTGFIGTALCRSLLAGGHQVAVLTRDRERASQHFQGRVLALESMGELTGKTAPQAIVNLAGQNLGSGRWTESLKREFVASRVGTTTQVVEYIAQSSYKHRPRALLSGSAVGYYGARGDEALTEASPPGDEFQADLCKAWEDEARKAEAYGVRVCLLRSGVVLGKEGGALTSMIPAFKWGLGGYFSSGRQWLSWIHQDDWNAMVVHLMRDESSTGPFNITSPYPVTNREFAKTLGKALHRPAWLRVPGGVVRLLVGEMAHLYLTGQRVIPNKSLGRRYAFRLPRLNDALQDIMDSGKLES